MIAAAVLVIFQNVIIVVSVFCAAGLNVCEESMSQNLKPLCSKVHI